MNYMKKETVSRDSVSAPESKGNVSFDGSGRVSVSVASIVGSARVQEQVRAVRAIEESQIAKKR
jgi:hypothetical protein